MSTNPTGRFAHRDDGLYLLLDRLFSAPIEDVWFSLTNPAEMAKWIGTYTGNPSTGGVRFQLVDRPYADGPADWQYAALLECGPPHRFHADVGEGDAAWRVFCHLREAGGMTTLTLGQRLKDPADARQVGPGWDYHLDRLVAMRAGLPAPEWSRYWPSHADYYRTLVLPDRTA